MSEKKETRVEYWFKGKSDCGAICYSQFYKDVDSIKKALEIEIKNNKKLGHEWTYQIIERTTETTVRERVVE